LFFSFIIQRKKLTFNIGTKLGEISENIDNKNVMSRLIYSGEVGEIAGWMQECIGLAEIIPFELRSSMMTALAALTDQGVVVGGDVGFATVPMESLKAIEGRVDALFLDLKEYFE
jgi:hypothetical protein